MDYKLTFKAFNEGLKANKILGVKCKDCGTITSPPKMFCSKCQSPNMDIIELKANGKIVTFSTINVVAEGREAECPYTIVMVELAEGPWIMGNLNMDPTKTSMELIGKAVKMEQAKVFPGDKYSAGDGARPIFALV